MRRPKLSFVTVVFRKELELIRAQLASAANFSVDRIARRFSLVINEPTAYEEVRSAVDAMVKALPARLRRTVQVVNAADIIDLDHAPGTGWRLQQAIKLSAHKLTNTDFIVALDAKNFFFKPVQTSDFIAPDGRAIAHLMGYRSGNVFFDRLVCARKYYGNHEDYKEELAYTLPSITPFVLRADLLRGMDEDARQRGWNGLSNAFLNDPQLLDTCEFLLYAAFAEADGGLSKYYATGPRLCWTFFRSAPVGEKQVALYSAMLHDPDVKLSGIHRNRLATEVQAERELFANLLKTAGAVDIKDDFIAMVRRHKKLQEPS